MSSPRNYDFNNELPLTEIERLLQKHNFQRTHVAERLQAHIERHKQDLVIRDARIKECERIIHRLIHGPYTNLYDLIRSLDNEHQRDALWKLDSSRPENQIYLINYEKNTSTDKKSQGVEGVFTIMGALKRDCVREEYKVKMYRENANEKGSFWCSCPDHKFNSVKKNMVCKHVCFLVCRVGKMLDPAFFRTKKLTTEQFETFTTKLENIHQVLHDHTICRPKAEVTAELFKVHENQIAEDDLCAICYDDLKCDATDSVLSCPTCKNCVHKACMMVWLERKDSCVYCRCNSWKLFKP